MSSISCFRDIVLLLLGATLLAADPATVGDLRCEQRLDPLGIDAAQPRLGWVMRSDQRGVAQTAYRILVASTAELIAKDQGDLWDSGQVRSSQSVWVEYGGKPLASRQRCHWKVRLWDRDGNVSAWSAPAVWTMGLLKPDDWKASWITAAGGESKTLKDRSWIWSSKATQGDPSILPPGTRWLRRHFPVPVGVSVASATLSLSADNSFVAFINGRQVLEGANWQNLVSAEVGRLLVAGDNVVAVAATNGGDSPNPAGLIGMLDVVLSDGKHLSIPVDAEWKTCDREVKGWAETTCDDAAWTPAVEVARFGGGQWKTQVSVASRLPMLRTSFRIEKPVRRAELAICGLGFYEPHLNGKSFDDVVLEPGWTNYRSTCLYRVHDLTTRLVQGENVLGVMLGNGMYNVTGGRYVKFTGSFGPSKLLAQLDITYTDGSTAQVVSDGGWRTMSGPVVFSCIYGGEDYDARAESTGWDQPGFDATTWNAVQTCAGPGGRLSSRSAPPIKVMEEFKTVKTTQPRPGLWVYDLGQNFSGWPKLTVSGPAGAVVKLIPGELLKPDGTVSQASSGGPMWFSYTLKGTGTETWHPRFSYYGFRYVQVEGAVPAEAADAPVTLPRIHALTGQFTHSSAVNVGDIACSNPDIARIHRLITAAIRSNFQSVLTDCPHREKLGWLEVSHLLAGGITCNYDAATFYAKICDDMRASQLDNGLVPDIAPEYTVFGGGFRDSPEWGSAAVINPWIVWQTYGDRRILEENYDTMKRYVAYLGSKAKDHIVAYGLGDWYDIGPGGPGESKLTSRGLTATAVWYQDIDILRQTAALLGRADDVATYTALAAQVKAAFNRTFLKADGNYDRASQTANAMPLALGLAEEGQRAAVLANLIKDVRGRGNKVTAGDVGFDYLVRALTEAERGDVLYDMTVQADGPGYLYQLKKGATTLTEAWDTNPGSSQNHCMLGHIEEWFFRGLGGLRPDPAGPGFAKAIIRPQPVGDLTWARVHHDSIRGRFAVAWKRDGSAFILDVTIPANASATVYMPARDARAVQEGSVAADQAVGVKFLRSDGGCAVYAIGSGTYSFSVR